MHLGWVTSYKLFSLLHKYSTGRAGYRLVTASTPSIIMRFFTSCGYFFLDRKVLGYCRLLNLSLTLLVCNFSIICRRFPGVLGAERQDAICNIKPNLSILYIIDTNWQLLLQTEWHWTSPSTLVIRQTGP